MGCPVGVHEGPRDIGLQLDDGEAQGGCRQRPGAMDGAVPLELRGRGQAELVRQVAPLVVVLAVLVLVEGQDVGAVLVMVHPVFALLTQLEQVVHACLGRWVSSDRTSTGGIAIGACGRGLEEHRDTGLDGAVCEEHCQRLKGNPLRKGHQ